MNTKEIYGYNIFTKPYDQWIESQSSAIPISIDDENNWIMLFMKEFPKISSVFFSGESVMVKPHKEYLEYLGFVLDTRFDKFDNSPSWRTKYSREAVDFLSPHSEYIENVTYKNVTREMLTWGSQENKITLHFLNLYELLKKSGDDGILITPKLEGLPRYHKPSSDT